MAVLTLQKDLFCPAFAAHDDDGDSARVARVFTNDRFLALDDNDVILDHIDNTAAPHGLARGHCMGGVLVFDRRSLLGGQETHGHALILVRRYDTEYRPASRAAGNTTRPQRSP